MQPPRTSDGAGPRCTPNPCDLQAYKRAFVPTPVQAHTTPTCNMPSSRATSSPRHPQPCAKPETPDGEHRDPRATAGYLKPCSDTGQSDRPHTSDARAEN
eukprot:12550873-Alexandrium_andersonii.AAC.1